MPRKHRKQLIGKVEDVEQEAREWELHELARELRRRQRRARRRCEWRD
jgi:hypothetical protein